ncbi:hypothetical protein [Clostridium sp.]|uniref:hypothetical protein n=1 Tax=Clostridium sp. TaxID=1506 RepID=UPI003F3D47A1
MILRKIKNFIKGIFNAKTETCLYCKHSQIKSGALELFLICKSENCECCNMKVDDYHTCKHYKFDKETFGK